MSPTATLPSPAPLSEASDRVRPSCIWSRSIFFCLSFLSLFFFLPERVDEPSPRDEDVSARNPAELDAAPPSPMAGRLGALCDAPIPGPPKADNILIAFTPF